MAKGRHQIEAAIAESIEAIEDYRRTRHIRRGLGRPATGHMPFVGHRTVKTINAMSKRWKPSDYGYELGTAL